MFSSCSLRLTPVSLAMLSISVANLTADSMAFLRCCSLSILMFCCKPTCNANTSLISLLDIPKRRKSSFTPLSAISLLSRANCSAPLAALPPRPLKFPEFFFITSANSSRVNLEPAAAACMPIMSLLKLAPLSLSFLQVPNPS